MAHRYRTCEKCYKIKRERSLLKHNGHYMCLQCNRSEGSLKSFIRAEKEVWEERKRRRNMMISKQEEAVLWALHGRKLSYSEMKERVKALRITVKASKNYNEVLKNINKPTFKEEFRKMTLSSRNSKNPI